MEEKISNIMHKYKKGEYRDQFVIAYITDLNDCEQEIAWSIKFCNILKKGLILLYISDNKYTKITVNDAQKQLQQINKHIELPYIHSYAALNGKTKNIINSLGDLLNGVMIVTQVKNDNNKNNPIAIDNLIKDFSSSRLAYFIFKNYNSQNNFKNIVVSMNALKECKEKILWASYFGRFADSITHIFYHRYKDEYLQRQLNLNIGFLRKMFKKLGIQTQNAHSLEKKNLLDVQALNYAKRNNCDACIFQTTKNKSFIELFTGLSEKKVLKNMEYIPAVFLNQRDDLFVMCE